MPTATVTKLSPWRPQTQPISDSCSLPDHQHGPGSNPHVSHHTATLMRPEGAATRSSCSAAASLCTACPWNSLHCPMYIIVPEVMRWRQETRKGAQGRRHVKGWLRHSAKCPPLRCTCWLLGFLSTLTCYFLLFRSSHPLSPRRGGRFCLSLGHTAGHTGAGGETPGPCRLTTLRPRPAPPQGLGDFFG